MDLRTSRDNIEFRKAQEDFLRRSLLSAKKKRGIIIKGWFSTEDGQHIYVDGDGNASFGANAYAAYQSENGKSNNPNSKYNEFVGVECGEPMNHEEALNGANPNYSKAGTAYTRNCYLCTPTYELRRRGFDVEAEASLPKELDNVLNRLEKTGIAFTEETFLDPETEEPRTPRPVYLNSDGQPNSIRIADDPDGARYLVGVTFKSGGGHAFFAEKIDGRIVYSDPQDPKRSHSYLANQVKDAKKGEFRFTRVDDQEINTAVIHKVCRPTGGK